MLSYPLHEGIQSISLRAKISISNNRDVNHSERIIMLQFVLEFTNILPIPTFCVDTLYPTGEHSITLELIRRLICWGTGRGTGGCSGAAYYTMMIVLGLDSRFLLALAVHPVAPGLPKPYPTTWFPVPFSHIQSCVISINWTRYHHVPHADNPSSWGSEENKG